MPEICVFLCLRKRREIRIMNNVIKSINNNVSKVVSSARFKNIKQKVASATIGTMAMVGMYTNLVFADGDTSAITKPLTSLKTLVVAIIGAVGVIILAKNVMEFAQAYQQQDSSTMNSALKGIVAGIMMAGISTVLSFLGY